MRAIYEFTNSSDGATPTGGVLLGSDGALYGTAYNGGIFVCLDYSAGCGVVFKLSPPASGATKWTETVLHEFDYNNGDGIGPIGTIAMDSAGAIYGETYNSGGPDAAGRGTVYKLIPPAAGHDKWALANLYVFNNGATGANPSEGLIRENNGVIFAQTSSGGKHMGGTIVRLAPPANGATTYAATAVGSFGLVNDGTYPNDVTHNAAGVIFGTTTYGGSSNNGVVFELTPPNESTKIWTETVLHTFSGRRDGSTPAPYLPPVLEKNGSIISITFGGGDPTCSCGVVFELTPPTKGATAWTFKLLHTFKGPDGNLPSGLGIDALGNVYVATAAGGSENAGTLLKLARPATASGTWAATKLANFNASIGLYTHGQLTIDSAGHVYGVAGEGGINDNGTVFMYSP